MRNNTIDVLKIVLALLVIALHIFPVGKWEGVEGWFSYTIASGITRIAVPTFFLISGYFLRNKLEDKVYVRTYCKRILLLYFVWQLIYLPDLIRFFHLGRYTKLEVLLQLSFGYWHLWYLLASVVAVFFLYLTRSIQLKMKYLLVLLLYAIGYGFQLAIQSGVIQNENMVNAYEIMGTTRNFLFFAFPMLLLGTLYENWKPFLVKWKIFYLPIWIVLVMEASLYYKYNVKTMDFLLCLPLLSMFTLYLVQETASFSDIKIPSSLSLGIYLCHPYAIRIIYEFLPQKTLGFTMVKYFLIVLVTLLLWFLVDKINKKLPYFF